MKIEELEKLAEDVEKNRKIIDEATDKIGWQLLAVISKDECRTLDKDSIEDLINTLENYNLKENWNYKICNLKDLIPLLRNTKKKKNWFSFFRKNIYKYV